MNFIPNKVINQDGAMRQIPVGGILCPVFLDKNIILIHPHPLCIRKYIDFSAIAGRMFPDIHRGAQLQYRRLLLQSAGKDGL